MIETIGVKLSSADRKRVLEEVDRGLNIICPVFDVNKDKIQVNILFVKNGISRSLNNVIILPEKYVKNCREPMLHELTHVILRDCNNRFFCEGVATYFQEKYGKRNTYPDFSGDSFKAILRRNKKYLKTIPYLSRNNDAFDAEKATIEGRKIAYIQAGSFISFLVKNYGEKSLAKLNSLEKPDYKAIYGRPLTDIETQWKAYIFDQ